MYTIGRRGTTANLLATPSELRAQGASVYRVDRGGDITYHGPGQLVGYPIVALAERPDVVAYVRGLEAAIIDALAEYGIAGRRIDRRTGVWVDLRDGRPAKICAIGVRVSRGVTTHGFALNVATDLAAFTRMIPCGFAHEAASFERLGARATLREVAGAVAETLSCRLGLDLRWEDRVAPASEAEVPPDAPVRSAEDVLPAAVA